MISKMIKAQGMAGKYYKGRAFWANNLHKTQSSALDRMQMKLLGFLRALAIFMKVNLTPPHRKKKEKALTFASMKSLIACKWRGVHPRKSMRTEGVCVERSATGTLNTCSPSISSMAVFSKRCLSFKTETFVASCTAWKTGGIMIASFTHLSGVMVPVEIMVSSKTLAAWKFMHSPDFMLSCGTHDFRVRLNTSVACPSALRCFGSVSDFPGRIASFGGRRAFLGWAMFGFNLLLVGPVDYLWTPLSLVFRHLFQKKKYAKLGKKLPYDFRPRVGLQDKITPDPQLHMDPQIIPAPRRPWKI